MKNKDEGYLVDETFDGAELFDTMTRNQIESGPNMRSFDSIFSDAYNGWVYLDHDGNFYYYEKKTKDDTSRYGDGPKVTVLSSDVADLDQLSFWFFIPPKEDGVAGTYEVINDYKEASEKIKKMTKDNVFVMPHCTYKIDTKQS
jgi:hypothetical protein